MKKLLLLSTFLCFGFWLWSQSDALYSFNQHRLNRQQTGMMVLGGWAAVNIAGGLALSQRTQGADKYFHLMNAGWNGVNLAIAGFGYFSAVNADPGMYNLYQTIQEQHRFQKILLFNAGLDVGYMLGGLYLIERSKNSVNHPDRLKGFGRSIVLQGGFLFAFDVINHLFHSQHNSALEPLLGSITFTGSSASLVFQF